MIIESIDQSLACLEQNEICIRVSGAGMDISELRSRASAIRNEYAEVSGNSIALLSDKPIELIVWLVAFDGFASKILVLPSSLDDDVRNELLDKADCKTLSNYTKNIQRKINIKDKSTFYPTKWLLTTSGTTGKPKIIEHTINSLCRTVKGDPTIGKKFTWGLLYDPARFAGLQTVLQALLGGGQLSVAESNSFEDQILSLIKNSVNAISATPSLWRKMLMDGRVKSLTLKQVTLGGEIADQMLLDLLYKYFPDSRIIHIYASTEAGVGFAVKDGKSGFPFEWIDNPNMPALLKISKNNTLLIKPSILPEGDEISSRTDKDGYIDTLDLVNVISDRVMFLGRASGAINVGGNKVHPEEIEQYIRNISAVDDVVVYAKKSNILGELVVADVVVDKSVNAKEIKKLIKEYCREHLEQWKCPAMIYVVDHIQTTSTGKVKRS